MSYKIKPFSRHQGNYTVFDNAIIDKVMPTLTASEWMVLTFIIRKTRGWNKKKDSISYSQFINGTGIGSNTTVKKAIRGLVEAKIIMQIATSGSSTPFKYSLNQDYEVAISETDTYTRNWHSTVSVSDIVPVSETVDTKETIKTNNKQTTATAFLAYENSIGGLSQMIGELIGAAIDEHGEPTVIEAINEAAKNNVRKWNYINAILESWKQNGRTRGGKGGQGKKQHSKTETADRLVALVSKYGRRFYKEARAELSEHEKAAIKKMGGWHELCRWSPKRIRIEYFQSLTRTSNDK